MQRVVDDTFIAQQNTRQLQQDAYENGFFLFRCLTGREPFVSLALPPISIAERLVEGNATEATRVEIVGYPEAVRGLGEDGKLIGGASSLFIAMTMNTTFAMPIRGDSFRNTCTAYGDALSWIFASTICGMACVILALTLSIVGRGLKGGEANYWVSLCAGLTWITLVLQAGFAFAASISYHSVLRHCNQTGL